MHSQFQVTSPKIKQNLHGLWTFLFFVLLLVICFSYNEVMSLIPTTQAAASVLYPGDANWDKGFYTAGPDDVPSALAVDGATVYTGGRFDFAGPKKLNKIGYWDGSAWQDMDGGFSNSSGSVHAIAVSGDNVYVGGYFSSVGSNPGVPARNIAVWSKTTRKWSTLQGGLDGSVNTIVANATDVYVSGNFHLAGGTQTNLLARWNIASQTWNTFGALGTWDTVNDIANDGQNVYVVGWFSRSGQPNANAAYWDGTAWHWIETTNSSDQLQYIAARNGQVYVTSSTWNGTTYNTTLKQWNGTAWVDVGPIFQSMMPRDLVISPEGAPVIALEGWGTNTHGIYRWNAGNSSFEPVVEPPQGSINKIAYQGANLVLSGEFFDPTCSNINKLVSWDGSQWITFGASTSVNGNVLSLAGPSENNLYFGGSFTCANGAAASLITHWNGTSLQPVANGLTGYYARLVWDNSRNRLYAAGSFTAPSNPAVRDIAYLENGTWMPVGNTLDPAGYGIDAITISGDSIVIAQRIAYDGTTRVMSLQNGTWQQLGQTMIATINALAVRGNDVYVAGSFNQIGDAHLNNIARWDGATWNALGSGVNSTVNTLAVYGNSLLVGGNFEAVNGDSNINYLARWDGTSWSSVGDWTGTEVSKILLYGGSIYAAHENWANNVLLSRWDGKNWSRVGHLSGSGWYGTGSLVNDFAILNGNIFVGGSFDSAGDVASSAIGWWHAPVIRGQVRNAAGPLAGVTILTNDGQRTTTDQSGNYTLTGASLGTTFSALKDGYTFQPPFLSVHDANIGLEITGQNFSALLPTPVPQKPTAAPTATQAPIKPAPVVSSISVTQGATAQGVAVDITGSNFQPIPVVRLGEYLLTNVRFIDASHLKGVLPALPGTGYYPLVVTNPDGQSGTLQNAFHQTAQIPSIMYVSPGYGRNNYSNIIYVTGSGFKTGSIVVLIDSSSVAHPLTTTFNSASNLSATIPARLTAGTYSLRVDNPAPNAVSSPVVSGAYRSEEGPYDVIHTWTDGIWQNPAALLSNTSGQLGVTVYRFGGAAPLSNLPVAFYLNSVAPANKLGDANIAVLTPNQHSSSTPVTWTTPAAGEYTILAVLDPNGTFAATNPGVSLPSKTVQQTITVQPKREDTVAPVIAQFTINGGETTTTSRSATLKTVVTDAEPSSGIANLYYKESVYSQASETWSPVAKSGWVPAGVNPYAWQLSSESGIKYLQVWAADYRGNVSQPEGAWINFIPALETLENGMTRAYRYHLTQGQQIYATIKAGQPNQSGDTDLYLWGEINGASTLLAWSDQPLGSDDTILYTVTDPEMDLQLEVFGFTDSAYSLKVEIHGQADAITQPQTLGAAPSSKELPAQPAVSIISAPVEQVGLPGAPVSEPRFRFFVPFVAR